MKSVCPRFIVERRLIDGVPTTFLEFQQQSGDLVKWRKSVLIVDSVQKPELLEVPEPWFSRGYCVGCSEYVDIVTAQLKLGHSPQNLAIGIAQGATDCFCNAQGKLSWEQLQKINKVTFYWS